MVFTCFVSFSDFCSVFSALFLSHLQHLLQGDIKNTQELEQCFRQRVNTDVQYQKNNVFL